MRRSTSTRTDGSPRVLLLNWRDLRHPEGGGAEYFAERVARGLIERGFEVTLQSSRYDGAVAEELDDGLLRRRRGGRFGVYLRAATELMRHGQSYDVVVDVQNGVPFWSPVWTSTPVIRVVHHVHREQWPKIFGPVRARFGWWLESRVATRVYREHPVITVSEGTRRELVEIGTPAETVTVVYSGNDVPADLDAYRRLSKADSPTFVVLGRLVPHKRVELVLETLRRLVAVGIPARAVIVGHGYWESELRNEAARLGVQDQVEFAGFVTDAEKHRLLATSWLHLLPSLKEGWGLAVIEAAMHSSPTVAFRSAGGTTESVVDGVTGVLADDEDDFHSAVLRLLQETETRLSMGNAAVEHARLFSWDATADAVEHAIRRVLVSEPQPSLVRREPAHGES